MQNCNRRYTSAGMEKSYRTRSDHFFELHKIIQILFDWDDAHLHGFHIPSDDIVIDDEGGFDPWGNHYNDFDTNIDFFFKITNGSATSMILEMIGVTRSI